MLKLSDEALEEMRFIMDGILSGTLNHIQTHFHCGTAHCFAGWKVVLDAKKKCPSLDIHDVIHDDYLGLVINTDFSNSEEWSYAQEDWGLTYCESAILFNVCATKAEQDFLVSQLEQGQRFERRKDFDKLYEERTENDEETNEEND